MLLKFVLITLNLIHDFKLYRTRTIIPRSLFETALNYQPWIVGLQMIAFPILVHKFSVIVLTALQYKPQ